MFGQGSAGLACVRTIRMAWKLGWRLPVHRPAVDASWGLGELKHLETKITGAPRPLSLSLGGLSM